MKGNRNLRRLLEDTPQAYYWVGFLFADGTFSDDAVGCHVALRDGHQMQALCDFLGYGEARKWRNRVIFYGKDKRVVPLITAKFGLRRAKTYYPPPVPAFPSDDCFYAFFAGMCDGDGNVQRQSGSRKDCMLRIKLHASWRDFLQHLSNKICRDVGVPQALVKIDGSGYAQLTFANSVVVKYLRRRVESLGLPLLNRKWEKIDLSHQSRYEVAQERLQAVTMLISQGLSNSQIAIRLGMSRDGVLAVKRRLKGG